MHCRPRRLAAQSCASGAGRHAVRDCQGCANPEGGLYALGCRSCTLREIVRGPEFFASLRACKLTPAYMARLQLLGSVEDVHEEVKAMAKTLFTGATQA